MLPCLTWQLASLQTNLRCNTMLLTAVQNAAKRLTQFEPSRMIRYSPRMPMPVSQYNMSPFHVRMLAPDYWEARLTQRTLPPSGKLLLRVKVDAVEYNNLVWVATDGSVYGYNHRNAAGVWHTLTIECGATNKCYINGGLILTTSKPCEPVITGNSGFLNAWIDTGEGDSGPLPNGYEWY